MYKSALDKITFYVRLVVFIGIVSVNLGLDINFIPHLCFHT